MNSALRVYIGENVKYSQDFLEKIDRVSTPAEADILIVDRYVENEKPVCVKAGLSFEIHYMKKISRIESEDPFLAVAVAFSLSHEFEKSFVYRPRFRLMFMRMLEAFIINQEVEDRNGMSHSERVAKLTQKFGRYLGIEGEDLDQLIEYAMLHDVGKIGLEQIMLFTPTRLRNWLHNGHDHTVVGSIFLATTGVLMDAAPVARSHHERWDGRGYPDNLKGDKIPYYARIIGLCDFYDEALNTVSSEIAGRPLNETETLKMIEEESGKMFDPSLAKKFLEMMYSLK